MKIPLIFLAYFDFDIIKRSLESFYEFSDFIEIIVVENKSVNSPQIKSFLRNELRNKKIHSCYFFQRNLSNNSLEIIISRELKSLLINEYFFISDGDLVLEDKNTYIEIKNIMDKHQDLFACGVSLDKRNLPLNNFPESAKWIPDDISEEDDFFEARTGVHLLMLRSCDFLKYWKFRESKKESLSDSSMSNYCYKFLGKRWARTKKSNALHLTWDSYNDINHPYTIEKLKKTFSQIWNHKDYFSLVEYESNNGKKIFFIDYKRFIFGLFFRFINIFYCCPIKIHKK
ncbi:MAG TPA: hypothetical protein VIN72_11850 [Lutibacter sp.]